MLNCGNNRFDHIAHQDSVWMKEVPDVSIEITAPGDPEITCQMGDWISVHWKAYDHNTG